MATEQKIAFLQGCQSAIPISLGYIPVAIAFGMTTTSAGLPEWVVIAMSLLIYAGASQFLLFASIMSGASVVAVVGLCALLDSRHLLYAPLMKRHLKSGQGMVWIAPLITDEVFATAMTKLDTITHQKPWLAGLAIISWISWWGGTLLGVYGGKLLANYPLMSAMMNFAFLALFVSLSTHLIIKESKFYPAFIGAVVVALLCIWLGLDEPALLIASFFGIIIHLLINQFKKPNV